jgi:hypothetical protein
VSESPTATAQEQGAHKPASGSPIRLVVRVILFGILLYLVCALPYDYFVARPGQVKAWEKLYNKRAEQSDPEYDASAKPGLLQLKNVGSGDVETTTETVAEALGRKPSKSTSENGMVTEIYSWRAGLPWKTYNIYVVYAERRDKTKKPRLENAFLNEPPSDLSVPTLEAPEDGPSLAPQAPGGGGPGGGRPGAGPGGAPPIQPPTDGNKRPDAEDSPAKTDGKKESADAPSEEAGKKLEKGSDESQP